MLDLVLTSVKETVKEVKIRESLGCSNHVLVKSVILRNVVLPRSGVRTLNFRRSNFRLFKELLDEISWEAFLRDKRVKQSW